MRLTPWLLWAALAAIAPAGSTAEDGSIIDIPAGPLSRSLATFAGRTGVTLSFDPALTRGLSAPQLSGRYDLQSGFAELLRGTDLEVVADDNGELILQRKRASPTESAPTAPAGATQTLPDITVEGVEPVEIGPHRGLRLTKDQIPGNIQTATGEDIKESGATSLTDFMNSRLQSVNINNYSGNPLQADVNYRGFTASPQIGTPQGLSVFFDGVRMNEPFGDVVNWDMIPLNAVTTFDVVPGSNPLYGLNTLGGALNLRTRNGFDDQGVEISLQGGSWGRIQGKVSGGGTYGALGGFVALTGFHEDGWRTNSPSDLKQGFAKLSYRSGPLEVNGSTLLVGDDLLGNGLIPRELYEAAPESVFTSPDQTKNTLRQFSLDGLFEVNRRFNITAQVYHRQSDRSAVGGDIYEDFVDMGGNVPNRIARRVVGRTLTRQDPNTGLPIEGGPACQYQDVNRDGVRDYDLLLDFNTFTPEPNSLNAPLQTFFGQNQANLRQLAIDFLGYPSDQDFTFRDFVTSPFIAYRQPLNGIAGIDCANVTYEFSDGQRNGRRGQTAGTRTGIIEGTPIGVITRSTIEQESNGASLQFNFNLDRHAFLVGTSFDANTAQYSNLQRLALIDASHNVYEDPVNIDPIFYAATHDIPVNEFEGFSNTLSAYFSETFSPFDNLHLSASGRYNRTQVKNNLLVNRTSDQNLASRTDYDAGLPEHILCPTSDPASCPTELNGSTFSELARLDPSQDQLVREGHAEKFLYHSFNPSFGINFLPVPSVNLYANWSQGTRAPSVVELGCAFDPTPVWPDPNNPGQYVEFPTNDLNGNPNPPTARSLSQINGSCSLPSTLSGDPFLPQIVARMTEAGIRGTLSNGWEWNAALYRTNLFDDLYFVSITPERSYFDTIGDTRRQGIELGLRGSYRDLDFSVNYGLTEATFESEFWITSRHNVSVNLDSNVLNNRGFSASNQIRIVPGDRIPGMPLHNLNASLTYHPTEKWDIGLTMIAHSASFVRGNENNDQRGGCFTIDPITGSYVPCDAQTSIFAQDFFGPGHVPGYMVFNARSTFEVAKGLKIYGEIDNLFDKDYFTAGRLGINPFSSSIEGAIGPSGWNYNSNDWRGTTFVGPSGPRAFWIGIDYRF